MTGVNDLVDRPALWEVCRACNYARHICPGCGMGIDHGETTCSECSLRSPVKEQF